jgi:hypothetical protein
VTAAPAFVRPEAPTVVRATAKPGHGFWVRTRTAKRWDGSAMLVGPFGLRCSFHRFPHVDQSDYRGPVAILVDTDPRLRVDGDFPFVAVADSTLTGWIRGDGFALAAQAGQS